MKIITLMIIFIISIPLQVYANSKFADLNPLELRSYCSGSTSSEGELTKCLEKFFIPVKLN